MINPLNCWKYLKSVLPQRKHETANRDGCESRKKTQNGAWLNPKRCCNGGSAAKPRIGEGSETRVVLVGLQAIGSSKWWASLLDEDIVHSYVKA